MSLETLTYRCGHAEIAQLYGAHAEREKRIAAAARVACAACRVEVAKMQAELMGLPALTGSNKQIAWASDVRLKLLAGIPEVAENLATAWVAATPEKREAFADQVAASRAAMVTIRAATSAKWWIEQRDHTAQQVVGAMVGAPATSTID